MSSDRERSSRSRGYAAESRRNVGCARVRYAREGSGQCSRINSSATRIIRVPRGAVGDRSVGLIAEDRHCRKLATVSPWHTAWVAATGGRNDHGCNHRVDHSEYGSVGIDRPRGCSNIAGAQLMSGSESAVRAASTSGKPAGNFRDCSILRGPEDRIGYVEVACCESYQCDTLLLLHSWFLWGR